MLLLINRSVEPLEFIVEMFRSRGVRKIEDQPPPAILVREHRGTHLPVYRHLFNIPDAVEWRLLPARTVVVPINPFLVRVDAANPDPQHELCDGCDAIGSGRLE